MSLASSATRRSTPLTANVPMTEAIRRRIGLYAELSRPRIAMMTMISVAVGFTLASTVTFEAVTLLLALIGITLLVASSSILNQCLERSTDGQMSRTSGRPLPSGRISMTEAASVGIACGVSGSVLLAMTTNSATAIAGLATLVVYVFGYTLLKTRSIWCTTIGAIPGAMPPVLGWLAAGGNFGWEVASLFAIFFVWQFPHFLAIGWKHRNDYQKAGLKMLPSFTDEGLRTGWVAVFYAVLFIPVAVSPSLIGLTGLPYLVVAAVVSGVYLKYSVQFLKARTDETARSLLYNSLLALPILLIMLMVDFLRIHSF